MCVFDPEVSGVRTLRPVLGPVAGKSRGASGVEYALVISLLLAGSVSSIELMEPRIESNYEDTAHDIGQIDLDYFEVTTTMGVSSTTTEAPTTTSTPPSTSAPPASSTTSSTSTSSTTTTSTTTSTTTPLPTTTSDPAVPVAQTTYEDRTTWSSSCGCPRARVRITLDDEAGFNLSYAWVEVEFITQSGAAYTGGKYASSSGQVGFARRMDADEFPVTVRITYLEDWNSGAEYVPSNAEFTLEW